MTDTLVKTAGDITDTYAFKMADVALRCAEYKVTDQASFESAATFLTGVKALQKEIEATFAPIKKPSHEAHKAICAQEKKFLGAVESAEAAIKTEMATWLKRLDDYTEIKADGIAVRKSYKFKIIEPSKIPDEFWVIDEKKIAQVVTALREQCSIEGIAVYSEPVISASAAKVE